MASSSPADRSVPPLLRLGRVDQLSIQVGYRAYPDGPAYQHFLVDLPVDAQGAAPFDERPWLAALEPALYAGADVPHHYSLHEHRWHTSWGTASGTLEIGLLVTMGSSDAATSPEVYDAAVATVRDLLDLAGRPGAGAGVREVAIARARRAVAASYALDAESLSLSAEQHNVESRSWDLTLRTSGTDLYEVVVGFVDGYAGAVHVRHDAGVEVLDSVGTE